MAGKYADLLLRAAARLREYAGSAPPGPWKTGGGAFRPWELVVDGDQPVVEFANDAVGAAAAEYAALVHPPVALAVARLLEVHAALLEAGELLSGVFAAGELLAVAMAVLREPGLEG